VQTPAERPLLFYSEIGVPTYTFDIFVSKPDGTDPINLTSNPAADADPSWSRDGKQIVFTSDRSGAFEIYSMQSDGSDVRRLTTDGAAYTVTAASAYSSPRFSPDSKKIAFVGRRDGTPLVGQGFYGAKRTDIYVMNPDGSGIVNITRTPDAQEFYPAWSPDGTKVAYLRVEYGLMTDEISARSVPTTFLIYIANADGSNAHPFHAIDPRWSDDAPAWSPDGNKIAYSAYDLHHPDYIQGWSIFVANADGSGSTRVTPEQGYYSRFPAWSPDGSKIFYSISSDEFWGRYTIGLAVINADGSDNHSLVWQPDRHAVVGSPDAWTR